MTYCVCKHTLRRHAGVRHNTFLTQSGHYSYSLKRTSCEEPACSCRQYTEVGPAPKRIHYELRWIRNGIAAFRAIGYVGHRQRRVTLTADADGTLRGPSPRPYR